MGNPYVQLGAEALKYTALPLRMTAWALSRPQQAVFQGARKGADALAEGLHEYRNLDEGPLSALRHLLANVDYVKGFGEGAWEGLTGQGEDVSGGQLTEGLHNNPYLPDSVNEIQDDAAGLLLDFIGDPLNVVGGAVAKPLGKVYRTAKNLHNLAPHHREIIDRLGAVRKYLDVDIPVGSQPGRPLTVITEENAGKMAPRFFPDMKGNYDKARGWYTQDVVASKRGSAAETVPHEFTHWARHKLPPTKKRKKAYETIVENSPRWAEKLRRIPNYSRLPDWRIGDELLAKATSQGKLAEKTPELRAVQDLALKSIDPNVFKEAAPIPLTPQLAASKAVNQIVEWLAGPWRGE